MIWPNTTGAPNHLTSPVITDPLTFAGAVTLGKHVAINNDDPAIRALTVKNAAAQSVPGQRWTDSADGLLAQVDQNGSYTGISNIIAKNGAASQTKIGAYGPASQAAIQFGSSGTDYLYLDGAGILRTPSALEMGGNLILDGGAGSIRFNNVGQWQTTVGAAGPASALPATPTKYFKVKDETAATFIVPAYAAI